MDSGISPAVTINDPAELAFELGLWLSGVLSFARNADRLFPEKDKANDPARDRSREFRLTYAALIRCCELNFRLTKVFGDAALAGNSKTLKLEDLGGIDQTASDDFSLVLRDVTVLNESLIESGNLGFGEWKAWTQALTERLEEAAATDQFIEFSEQYSRGYLPAHLKKLLEGKSIPFAEQADLDHILPRFGQILKWLSVVGRMLRNDEPLKPTLLIFARVYDHTQELINYINARLSRFPNEEAELFNSLDGASYTASLELKKVYQQELSGIVTTRPAPSVYARIETGYALLSDSFQQILAGFARLSDPTVAPADLFPNFQIKLDQSIILRDHLWQVLQVVKAAEQNPEKQLLTKLKNELTTFLEVSIRYLFYKDRETVDRFGEEIFAADEKKDLVPILHRFSAYLETLLGQVNMRNVLANHPFEAHK